MTIADARRDVYSGLPPIEPVRFDARDIDPCASPRVDLDAFVNARWRSANPIPADRTAWDCFAILAERALRIQAGIAAEAAATDRPASSAERIVGDFWATAMLEDTSDASIELLRTELTRIANLETSADICAYLCERHARGDGLVFRFDVEPDFENPQRAIAYISQGGLGLPDRDHYFDASKDGATKRDAYVAHIAAMLQLGDASHADAVQVLEFETRLAQASLSRETIARDVGTRFRPIDPDMADRSSRNFSWRRFWSAQGVSPPRFSLAMPDFHATVDALLETAPLAIWRAYLAFHTIDDAAPFLDDTFAARHHAFHGRALRGRQAMKPRWKRALDAIDAEIGQAMGQLYVARAFTAESKRRVQRLVDRLRAAFKRRLERLEWMSAEGKRAALVKLTALRTKIGFPDRWRDWSDLATSRESLYANVLAARAHEHRWRLAKLARAVDRDEWPMAPQTVNAGYDPQRNEIVFPAVILQPPFFDPAADAALNFGGIGAVIAHEITHAFDDQGSRFDAQGRFENWWTPSDRERFDALAARLAAQFDAMRVGSDAINGRLTLGENIADFGGLAVACEALKDELAATERADPVIDGYTQLQRFFLNWAVIWRQKLTPDEAKLRLKTDPHAPARARANSAPANLGAFAEAFACKPNDPMLQSAKVRLQIW